MDAELLAAPLVASSAFTLGQTALDSQLTGATCILWRETERAISSCFPGLSLDELVVRRDAIWFGNRSIDGPLSLADYFRYGCAHFFNSCVGANPLFAHRQRHDRDLRREWRWAKFAIPSDLILAAIGRSTTPDEVISPVLRRLLEDSGFAETHLHLKAAIDFPMLWRSVQEEMAGTNFGEGSLIGPGADFDEGRSFASWLIRSSTVRVLLAEYLSNASFQTSGFASFLGRTYLPRFQESSGPIATSVLNVLIKEFGKGELLQPRGAFSLVRNVYRNVAQIASTSGSGDGVDPIGRWFRDGEHLSAEHAFLLAAFDYLLSPRGRGDHAFAKLFWQTQRVRVRFYRHIVQRPLTPGLQFFTRTYARLSVPRKALGTSAYVRSAIRMAGSGLRSLEVRVVPEDTVAANLKVLFDFHQACLTHAPEEAGVVYHFSRSRGDDAADGRPAAWGSCGYDNPRQNASGFRFSDYYLSRSKEAAALAEVIQMYPGSLERLRGIDLCTDELGVPLWVLKPLVEHVRNAARVSSSHASGARFPLHPLRTTVHAGEDYIHLLGGIRRVAEAVERLSLTDGDRIGHAIALGTSAVEWADRIPSVAMSCAERMFDLIWARGAFIVRGIAANLRLIEIEIERLSRYIFARRISLEEIQVFYDALHTTNALRSVGFPSGPKKASHTDPVQLLLRDWLTDPGVFHRSQSIECVSTTIEAKWIQKIQDDIRRDISAKGIVVEINPVSNLLIGNLGDLSEHPLWRLNKPGLSNNPDAIRVCIGSDDPITFASSLLEEYQLLADSIVESGLAAQDSDEWLGRARQAGMEARFTLKPSDRSLLGPISSAPRLLPLPL